MRLFGAALVCMTFSTELTRSSLMVDMETARPRGIEHLSVLVATAPIAHWPLVLFVPRVFVCRAANFAMLVQWTASPVK